MDASHIILFVTGLLIGVVVGWYLVPVEDDWPDEEPTLQDRLQRTREGYFGGSTERGARPWSSSD